MTNVRPVLSRECGNCKQIRPIVETKCPNQCITLQQRVVALCTCGVKMMPDGRTNRYVLFRCPSCGAHGRLNRR